MKGERRRRRWGHGGGPERKREPARPPFAVSAKVQRVLLAAGVFLLVALGFAIRIASPWSTVFAGPAGVRLFDTDSYYHLRHARYAAAHFPHLQAWDPGVYPDGQPRRYAGLFDVAIAGAALVAGAGHPSEQLVARVAAFTPAVLGTLALAALFWLGVVTAGRAVGLGALLLVTLYPGTFVHRSLLGAVDHHVAEVLLAVLTAVGLGRTVGRGVEPTAPPWRRWLPDFAAALPLAVFFFTWFGAPIYLVLIAATFFGVGTLALARGDDVSSLARAAFRYGAGLLLLTLAVRVVAPGFVMEAGYFKKALGATALFALGFPGYLVGVRAVVRRAARRSPERRGATAIVALGAGFVVVGLLLVAMRIVPAARNLAGELLGVKTSLVTEQAPLSLGKLAFLGGAPTFIALFALPLALVGAWRRRDALDPRALRRLAVILFSTLLVALWLRTHDYGYVAPPFLALLTADVLERAWRATRAPLSRLAGAVAVVLLLVLPVWPAGAAAPVVPDHATIAGFMVLRPGWEQALAWMKAHTPPLAVPLDAPVTNVLPYRQPPGNYGIEVFWDFGHYVAELGQRPPVASGGISVSTASWFLLDDEEQAVRALSRKLRPGESVRYVIADGQTVGDFALSAIQMAGGTIGDYVEIFPSQALSGKRLMRFSDRFSRSMASRLYEQTGDGLAHFRLVYESPDRTLLAYHAPRGDGLIVRKATRFSDDSDEGQWRRALSTGAPVVLPDEIVYDGLIAPAVKIFEQVAGARLVGTAPAGATVEARLALTARDGGDSISYRRGTTADVTGRFEISVPYPTEPDAAYTDVFATGPYALLGDGVPLGHATVSTSAVDEGRTVSVTAP